ncbi:hypothetical protein GCM10007147_18580 [Nocardiopsis kunsanensis]|uniref:Uncharacterized protein n=1 Tax=Nocardiopsis kunsanensis TaxID=141693 RepID=A0A919CGZ0_9ACTN|nr:hypothetical protein [Nocardiopsis kunsanensis]GHD23397.1 hypothetical protein GCM10007147_18580 [Nocardiopsis kunsanensis]
MIDVLFDLFIGLALLGVGILAVWGLAFYVLMAPSRTRDRAAIQHLHDRNQRRLEGGPR